MLDLSRMSASEIGSLVNKKILKPSDVIKYFINRINERNSSINAFVDTDFKYALDKAYELDKEQEMGKYLGPFAGVPFAMKDFLPSKPGFKSTHGGVKCLISIDEYYSGFTKAMEELGGIAIGKTNAPSYGFRGVTDNKMFGPTKNPFNLEYNPGGSSGGSAAAVADSLVPIAEGGDAGGSIRIPASFTNLYGFKAGIGTIPSVNRPDAFSASHPYCFGGGVTKSVEDAAILLSKMSYYDPKDPLSRPQNKDYCSEMKKDVSHLKIAYTKDFDLFNLDNNIKKSFDEAISKIKAMGFICDEVHFNFKHTANEMADAWCMGITIDPTIELNNMKKNGMDLLRDHSDDFPEEFIYWKDKCDNITIDDLYNFNLVRTDVLDNLEEIFKDYDFIISPVSCIYGIKNMDDRNTKGPSEINGVKIEPLIGWTETFLVNFSGHPAASIPAGIGLDNIPFGIQAISRKYEEDKLLALSYAIEKKYPWNKLYDIALERE